MIHENKLGYGYVKPESAIQGLNKFATFKNTSRKWNILVVKLLKRKNKKVPHKNFISKNCINKSFLRISRKSNTVTKFD